MSDKLAPGTAYTYRWKEKHPDKARESHRKAQLKWRAKNRERVRNNARKWNAKNRKKANAYRMNQYYKDNYGITKEQRDTEIVARDSRCDSCNQKRKLCIDHFTGTKTIRGFLCDRCNTTLGKFKDCPIAIRQLADYTERRQCPSLTQPHLPLLNL